MFAYNKFSLENMPLLLTHSVFSFLTWHNFRIWQYFFSIDIRVKHAIYSILIRFDLEFLTFPVLKMKFNPTDLKCIFFSKHSDACRISSWQFFPFREISVTNPDKIKITGYPAKSFSASGRIFVHTGCIWPDIQI